MVVGRKAYGASSVVVGYPILLLLLVLLPTKGFLVAVVRRRKQPIYDTYKECQSKGMG